MCAGICILGTRRWELQVSVAHLPAPAQRRRLSPCLPGCSHLAQSPECVSEMMPALPLPSCCGGDTLEPLAQALGPQAWISCGSGYRVPDTSEGKTRPVLCCAGDSALGEFAKPPLRLHNSNPSIKDPPAEGTRSGGNACKWAMWSWGACGQGQHPAPSSGFLPAVARLWIFQEKPQIQILM